MSSQFRTIVFAASAALFVAPLVVRAQSARVSQVDSRWDPWLGCWGVDTNGSGHQQFNPGVTCIVPVAGSHAVEALTYARGKVVARDRLDNGGEPHPVSGQGCRGFETIDWSASGRRALLRSEFMCGGTKGSSSTIYAILPGGDWLRVENVRSGGGTAVSVERRRPVALIGEVSSDAARTIEDRRLAITTARAAAAAPISPDEIVEAIHVVDPGVVRTWIVASGQSFDLDGSELASLIRADVPQSVLQVMMPAEQPMNATVIQRAGPYYSAPPAPTAYASATAGPPEMETMYACPSAGCNGSPNPYSILNGYGVNPYPYGGYPFSPFSTFGTFPGAVIVTRGNNNNNNNHNNHNNNHGDGHRPSGRPSGPVRGQPVAGPVGRRR